MAMKVTHGDSIKRVSVSRDNDGVSYFGWLLGLALLRSWGGPIQWRKD